MKMNPLDLPVTALQKKAIRAVWELRKELDCPPTNAEVGERMGLHETTARQHIETLVEKECLHRVKGKKRTLAVTVRGKKFLRRSK